MTSRLFLLTTILLSVSAVVPQAFSQELLLTAPPLVTPRQETVICQGVDGEVRFDILVEIPNTVDSPNALSMRVSDPNVSEQRAEIALFEASAGVLNNNNGTLVGYVDHGNPNTARKGERIGGTTLGRLRSIMLSLDIDFDLASSPLKKYSAQALYLKLTGEQLVQDLDCVRQR